MSEVPSRAAGAKSMRTSVSPSMVSRPASWKQWGPMEYAVSQLVERRERNDDGALKRPPPRPDDVAGTIAAPRFPPVELDRSRRHGAGVAAPIHFADRALEPEANGVGVVEHVESVRVLDELIEDGAERGVRAAIRGAGLRARTLRRDGDRRQLYGEMAQRQPHGRGGVARNHNLRIERRVCDL